MHIRDVSRRDIIKMALEALSHSNEGHAVVLVDVRDGSVEVISKSHEFEDWAARSFDYKKVIFSIKEEAAAGLDFESLYKKYKHDICCTIMELKDRFPHLV